MSSAIQNQMCVYINMDGALPPEPQHDQVTKLLFFAQQPSSAYLLTISDVNISLGFVLDSSFPFNPHIQSFAKIQKQEPTEGGEWVEARAKGKNMKRN